MLTLSALGLTQTELGNLLHKNPARIHSLPLSFGETHLIYKGQEAEVFLQVNVDPIALIRGRTAVSQGISDLYVNDRP